ncbi:MAG: branched-chain amino acid transaminase [Planctomycetota bacterium]|jgi:branched-chain amino acid aminotransferase|nr:branched-chain amino acid transaminase [Planctomycetota bacterium]
MPETAVAAADSSSIAYLNGEWKPLSDCQVPINTHALQYGTGCFEGIRGYWDGSRVNLLFLREHFERLYGNAKMLLMQAPSVDEMYDIAVKCVQDNKMQCNVYLRPVVFKCSTNLGPELSKEPDGYMCYLMPLNDYLDTSKGLEVCVSSWVRLGDNSIPTRAKATGGYLNSALAKSEAVLNGYDEAIFLNDRGQVSEGSAENLFLVRDGVLITPDKTSGILEGITRQTVIDLARAKGVAVEERAVARTELYRADELFLVGTGCQVSWVRTVDRRAVGAGERGPITGLVQDAYENAVYGRDPACQAWLTGC